jgi:hypothetical protein
LYIDYTLYCMKSIVLWCASGAVMVLMMIVALPKATTAFAAAGDLTGQAWSSNIGWIDFGNAGATYGVKLAMSGATRNLSGYAWSSNIGWVTFNNTECPVGVTGNCQPRVEWGVNGGPAVPVKGFARACGVFANGCTSGTPLKNGGVTGLTLGGWDGFISLGDSNTADSVNYGVKINTGTGVATGRGWGSEVVGWVDFNGVKIDVTCTPTNPCPPPSGIKLIPTAAGAPVPAQGSIGSLPNTITVPSTDTTVVLSWYKTDASVNYTSCTQTPAGSPWSNTINAGTIPFGPTNHTSRSGITYVAPSRTYTLSCITTDGVTNTATAVVNSTTGPVTEICGNGYDEDGDGVDAPCPSSGPFCPAPNGTVPLPAGGPAQCPCPDGSTPINGSCPNPTVYCPGTTTPAPNGDINQCNQATQICSNISNEFLALLTPPITDVSELSLHHYRKLANGRCACQTGYILNAELMCVRPTYQEK